jgi:hypothetical protein
MYDQQHNNSRVEPNDSLNNSSYSFHFDIFTFIRISLVIIALTMIITNSIYGYVLPKSEIACLLDNSFEFTSGINNYLHDHVGVKNALLITSSLCVDSLILIMFIYWCLWGKSWRIFVTLILFYGFRAIVQVYTNLI